MSCYADSSHRNIFSLVTYRHKKNVEPESVARSTICRLSHCLFLSKRATPKAPRRMYNDTPQTKKRKDTIIPTHLLRNVYKHPKGRSRCFVFDRKFEFARFTYRQNQSVQLRLFMSVCLIPPTLSRAFGRIKCHKVMKVIPYSQTFE